MKIKDLSLYDPDTPWLDYINRILSKEIVQVSQGFYFFSFDRLPNSAVGILSFQPQAGLTQLERLPLPYGWLIAAVGKSGL